MKDTTEYLKHYNRLKETLTTGTTLYFNLQNAVDKISTDSITPMVDLIEEQINIPSNQYDNILEFITQATQRVEVDYMELELFGGSMTITANINSVKVTAYDD